MSVIGIVSITFVSTIMFFFLLQLFIQWLQEFCKKKEEEKQKFELEEKNRLRSEIADMVSFEINKFARLYLDNSYKKGGKK